MANLLRDAFCTWQYGRTTRRSPGMSAITSIVSVTVVSMDDVVSLALRLNAALRHCASE